MSFVPRQMIVRPFVTRLASASLAMASALGAGCATTAQQRSASFTPVALTSPHSPLRVMTHGDLLDRLSGVSENEDSGWLETFLYGPPQRTRRHLRNPQGLAIRGNTLFVCDQGLPDVLKIDLATGRLSRWTAFDDQPTEPVDVSIDDNGSVYVADVGSANVLVYDEGGRLIRKLSPSIDPAADFQPISVLATDGVLYVGDRAAREIHRFDTIRNVWLSAWRSAEDSAPLVAPTGLALTPDRILLVADAISGVVHRIDRQGAWLTPIGKRGHGTRGLVRPVHVCCAESGAILVTDAASQSLSIFDPNGVFVTEVSTQNHDQPGWMLPGGVVSLPRAAVMNALGGEPSDATANSADDAAWFLVTDTLGADSLTLLSVTAASPGGSP